MAKRNTSNRNADQTTGGAAGSPSGSGSAEDRVIALAEQLGRIVGTMQAKAGGLLDRDALMQQVSQVRDGATHLLEQLGVGGSDQPQTGSTGEGKPQPAQVSSSAPNSGGHDGNRSRQRNSRGAAGGGRDKASAEGPAGTARQNNQQTTRGRSGGVVDAPGKKHRKPVPNEVRANAADTGRLAKMKMVNASRRRGR